MASTDQANDAGRILKWLVLYVVLLLVALLTLATWTHKDYHYSVFAVFAVGLVLAALVLPAWAVRGLTVDEEH